jgi:hypothetical protein
MISAGAVFSAFVLGLDGVPAAHSEAGSSVVKRLDIVELAKSATQLAKLEAALKEMRTAQRATRRIRADGLSTPERTPNSAQPPRRHLIKFIFAGGSYPGTGPISASPNASCARSRAMTA